MSSKTGWILFFIALFGCVAAGSYGYDQHQKRLAEEESNRRRLASLEQRIAQMEAELASLRNRLGSKNFQVRVLASKVQELKVERSELRLVASA